MADVEAVKDKLRDILAEKARQVKNLLGDSARSGIHVDILICAELLQEEAWKYIEKLGAPREFFQVLPDLSSSRHPGHLQVKFDNILPR